MIRRDPVTRNIIITPEDIPNVMTLLEAARDELQMHEKAGKIPGSLRHIYEMLMDTAERFERAVAE